MSVCYLNGEFLPLADASISVLDRGFVFGDGVYELIPVFKGRPFRLAEHLDRLARSLHAIHISNPFSRPGWVDLVYELIHKNGGGDQSLYIQVTRGVAARDHALPKDVPPTIFVMSSGLNPDPDPDPVSAIIVEDIRWQRCDIKSTSLLANVLLRREAAAAGAFEAILVRDDYVTEGAASNVFVVVDGCIKTPPKSNLLLPGITRDVLIEVLSTTDTPVVEAAISLEQCQGATEIWLTSSSREILPVGWLDGKPVGQGLTGECYQRARAHYARYKG